MCEWIRTYKEAINTPPKTIKPIPGKHVTHLPPGNTRSARMNTASAAMVATLIAPPANIKPINIQQQPMQ